MKVCPCGATIKKIGYGRANLCPKCYFKTKRGSLAILGAVIKKEKPKRFCKCGRDITGEHWSAKTCRICRK